MQSITAALVEALWFILPAYFANSIPVDVSKLKILEWLGKPLDGGRSWGGKRILGDGKTWRGFFSGILAGTLIGALQMQLQGSMEANYPTLPDMTINLAFMLSFGAILGDMLASFFKRRIGMPRGEPAPLLDQLDFVFGAAFFAWLWSIMEYGAIVGSFERMVGFDRFFLIVLVTPFFHLLGNGMAWVAKLKDRPW